ncbi:hypothetical protein [Mycobacteroides abscessus]|uniref:hypothetical protein n=1 Tax=Mycobacteroides abscessus TaxID=36809 RepID=UPI000C2607A5|nr:hypothetical protein [Mycobacteroides abscessus]
MLSTLRLFKALPVEAHGHDRTIDQTVAEHTLAHGFVLAPDITATYSNLGEVTGQIINLYGRGAAELNATFHKSFATVRDADSRMLALQQVMHYLSTYGAQLFNVYSDDFIYIPAEQLDLPAIKEPLPLVVIRAMTADELKAALTTVLGSGIALSAQTVKDAAEVAVFTGFTADDIAQVRNKEARTLLYRELGLVPTNPEEFLRFLVHHATGSTLLIKNDATIAALTERDNTDLAPLFDRYAKTAGLPALASVFNRFKPLFLALRSTEVLRPKINELRRLARTHHKPLAPDLLNNVTAMLKNNQLPAEAELASALNAANVFRKIRLAYALKFRTTDAESILYRIRNGRSMATSFTFPNKRAAAAIYEQVSAAIATDIAPNVAGKTVFIPEGLHYGLPATEKQFTGTIPSGSYVELDGDMVVGVHWNNVNDAWIDLDLSIANADGKIGWDGTYRSGRHDLQFSGDITSAPPPYGATEAFRIGEGDQGTWLMHLNYYNYHNDVPVPFKIVVAHNDSITANYTVDPNKLVAHSNSIIDVRHKTLGLLTADENSRRFYFAETGFAGGRTARHDERAEHALRYLVDFYSNTIDLAQILSAAGATITTARTESDIDLSPEAVDKSTFLNLLQGATAPTQAEPKRKPANA